MFCMSLNGAAWYGIWAAAACIAWHGLSAKSLWQMPYYADANGLALQGLQDCPKSWQYRGHMHSICFSIYCSMR